MATAKRAKPSPELDDGLREFKKAVQELKTKSQSKISHLTTLAETLQGFAPKVIQIIDEAMANAEVQRLQPLISVLDSILKRVGKDYKTHLSERMPEMIKTAQSKCDAVARQWIKRMVNESWRRHELLPSFALDKIDLVLESIPPAQAAPAAAAASPPPISASAPAQASLAPPLAHAPIPATAVESASLWQSAPQPLSQPPPSLTAAPTPSTIDPVAFMQQQPPMVMSPQVPPQAQASVPAQSAVAPAPMQTQLHPQALHAAPQPPPAAPQQLITQEPLPAALVEGQAQPEPRAMPTKTPPIKAPPPKPLAPSPAPAASSSAPGAVVTSDASAAARSPAPLTAVKKELPSETPKASPAPATAVKKEQTKDSPEVVERRLAILTKIIEKRTPDVDELQEIMKVPEVKKAIKMQHGGDRQEAMKLLSAFKQDLERKHNAFKGAKDPRKRPEDQAQQQAASRQTDPRQAAKPAGPRQTDVRPPDPRQVAAGSAPAAQADPRQQATAAAAKGVPSKRTAEQPAATSLGKQQRVGDPSTASEAQAPVREPGSEDEAISHDPIVNGQLQPARQILQGLPSIGFSESWLRQFLEQMPSRAGPQAFKLEAPCVGRKVLGASGEQLVYVDELVPNEVLLLMQLVFLLEERLRRSSGGVDLAQRIPHTFSYLQMEPAIDVMLKRFFDELPFQCTTTGLRFASREKLRKHNDHTYRRRTLAQQKQRGADARGWMESIPEWVGNRDLVVGPALFKLGGSNAEDQAKAQALQQGTEQDACDDEDEDSERNRWVCPLDERRAICPVSGEPFERTWSAGLNDWAFADVAASELSSSSRPLRFPRSVRADAEEGPEGVSKRLTETAVLFKRSCFLNTPHSMRLQALEECRSVHSFAPVEQHAEGSVAGESGAVSAKKTASAREDKELIALMRPRPSPRKLF